MRGRRDQVFDNAPRAQVVHAGLEALLPGIEVQGSELACEWEEQ